MNTTHRDPNLARPEPEPSGPPEGPAAPVSDAAACETTWLDRQGSEQETALDGSSAARTPDGSADLLPTEPDLHATVDLPRRASVGRTPERGARPETGSILGDYELLDRIGRGGMGVVYRARQRSASRVVALKLIKPDWLEEIPEDRAQQAVVRFQVEAQATAQLSHENIVTVYDVGQVEGRHYYSMRYIEGKGLDEVLREGPLPARKAAELLEPVARALQHAHERGVLHRDLKPSNILIDEEGTPFVTDFGLAKLLEGTQQLTRTHALIGSPPYMSPEQARDPGSVEVASDVYSLGATLYEMLTGRPPFQAADAIETLRQVVEEEPAAPSRLNPGIDRDLETVCLKCLEKEPGRRYRSAGELADDLDRYVRGEAVHARRIGSWERARKWVRRRPSLAALLVVAPVGCLALVGVVVAQLYNVRLEQALGDAEASSRQARAAVNLLVDLSEKKLVDEPGLQPLRKELLEAALPFYRDFLRRAGADAGLRAELTGTYLRVAKIAEQVGAPSEALDAYRKAQALGEALVRTHPEVLAYRNDVAECEHGKGIAHRALGHPDDSLAAYRRARALREPLLAAQPTDRRLQSDLARTYGYLGDIELETGRLEDALQSYSRSQSIRERIAATEPAAEIRFELGRSHENLGRLHAAKSDLDEAGRQFERARELHQQLVREAPRNPRFLADLARIRYRLGLLHRTAGRAAEALSELTQAREIQERLAADSPTVVPYRTALARTSNELGRVQLETGQAQEAMRTATAAQALLERLATETTPTPELHSDLARAWNNLGKAQEALGRPLEALSSFRTAVEHQRTAFDRADAMVQYRTDLSAYEADLARAQRQQGQPSPG